MKDCSVYCCRFVCLLKDLIYFLALKALELEKDFLKEDFYL
jgi:hypothetical protein